MKLTPLQMVPYRLHFSVLIYNKHNAPTIHTDRLRDHIASQLPLGTGVGEVDCAIEGPLNMVEKGWDEK